MYEAKRRRSGTERFATALERDSRQRLQTSQDLDRAFERGEFVLHYQPKCDASSGAPVAVEALGAGSTRSAVCCSPMPSSAVIEQRGFTTRLTDTVLALAVAQARAGHCLELPIAVNLTATDLLDRGMARLINCLLARGLDRPPAYCLSSTLTKGCCWSTHSAARHMHARPSRAPGIAIAAHDGHQHRATQLTRLHPTP